MKAMTSISAGICIINSDRDKKIIDFINGTSLPPETAHITCACLDDWEYIEAPDLDTLIKTVKIRYVSTRVAANVESCLIGMPTNVQYALLLEIEDHLNVSDNHFIRSILLRAPLAKPGALKIIIHFCLSNALGATAQLLNYVHEMQPELNHLSDQWLALSEDLFTSISGGRQYVWSLAVENGIVTATLESKNYTSVIRNWENLAFKDSRASNRIKYPKIAKTLSQRLYPSATSSNLELHKTESYPDKYSHEDTENLLDAKPQNGHIYRQRAQKQIDSITGAIAEGQDAKANQYLEDLIADQLQYSEGERYAVKSLCNIAQRAADMYRTDFEYLCLSKAVELAPNDTWTAIQLADHMKRVGRFQEAIDIIKISDPKSSNSVTLSSLADIYTQMGQYDQALLLYNEIPNGEHNPAVRGAKADALRRSGNLQLAQKEYEKITMDGLASTRTLSGQAEIAKLQGKLGYALDLYKLVLADEQNDERSLFIYTLAISNVLIRMGKFIEAYQTADNAVQMRPFSKQAKILRAVVQGLLGNAEKALEDIPYLGQGKAYNEWVNDYVRGLLLLMLDRNRDALHYLQTNVEKKFVDEEGNRMLRLASAVSFLRAQSGATTASNILTSLSSAKTDAFAELIRSALGYHVAASLHNKSEMTKIEKQLSNCDDQDIRSLLKSIKQKNWKAVERLEIRILLRLAS